MEQTRAINILMAEDDDDDYFLTQKAFGKGKLTNNLFRVENGKKLLTYLEECFSPQSTGEKPVPPDLILLDLNMPVMDGREALKKIKESDVFNHIPVIILTTSKAEEDIIRSYKLGVNSFINKPVNFSDFVEKIIVLQKYWFQIVELPSQRGM